MRVYLLFFSGGDHTKKIVPWESGAFCHFLVPSYDIAQKMAKLLLIENSEIAY